AGGFQADRRPAEGGERVPARPAVVGGPELRPEQPPVAGVGEPDAGDAVGAGRLDGGGEGNRVPRRTPVAGAGQRRAHLRPADRRAKRPPDPERDPGDRDGTEPGGERSVGWSGDEGAGGGRRVLQLPLAAVDAHVRGAAEVA